MAGRPHPVALHTPAAHPAGRWQGRGAGKRCTQQNKWCTQFQHARGQPQAFGAACHPTPNRPPNKPPLAGSASPALSHHLLELHLRRAHLPPHLSRARRRWGLTQPPSPSHLWHQLHLSCVHAQALVQAMCHGPPQPIISRGQQHASARHDSRNSHGCPRAHEAARACTQRLPGVMSCKLAATAAVSSAAASPVACCRSSGPCISCAACPHLIPPHAGVGALHQEPLRWCRLREQEGPTAGGVRSGSVCGRITADRGGMARLTRPTLPAASRQLPHTHLREVNLRHAYRPILQHVRAASLNPRRVLHLVGLVAPVQQQWQQAVARRGGQYVGQSAACRPWGSCCESSADGAANSMHKQGDVRALKGRGPSAPLNLI